MAVDFRDATGTSAVPKLADAARCLLGLLDRHDAVISVSLVDDDEIRRLNRDWRGKDRATDVLSFPQNDPGDDPLTSEDTELGDVVISLDTARAQADAGGWTLEEEVNRLLLHGVLHLLGYDHESGGEEERRMKAEELRLAEALVHAGHPCACDEDE